jgi:hypothetical protein
MNAGDLVSALEEVPANWKVTGTSKGSIEFWNPEGNEYGYVFTDGRPTKHLRNRPGSRYHRPPSAYDAGGTDLATQWAIDDEKEESRR